MSARAANDTGSSGWLVALIALAAMLAACATTNKNVPPLLRGATAHGGWWGACPPVSESEATTMRVMGQLALSPELNARLAANFPAGSREETLIESLNQQGFTVTGQCASDPSIRIASYDAKGSGFVPHETHAQVYWQADSAGRIVWTKGFVRYTGL